MKNRVKIYEIPIGGKFFYDNIIWILLDIKYDLKFPDEVFIHIKKFKSNYQMSMRMCGNDVLNRLYYTYTRRDVNSFTAGFNMAIDICVKHMSKRSMKKAGIEYDLNVHMKMLEAYKKFKKNDGEMNNSNYNV